MIIGYRENEAIYIQARGDRVTVIFRTVFNVETDRVFGERRGVEAVCVLLTRRLVRDRQGVLASEFGRQRSNHRH